MDQICSWDAGSWSVALLLSVIFFAAIGGIILLVIRTAQGRIPWRDTGKTAKEAGIAFGTLFLIVLGTLLAGGIWYGISWLAMVFYHWLFC